MKGCSWHGERAVNNYRPLLMALHHDMLHPWQIYVILHFACFFVNLVETHTGTFGPRLISLNKYVKCHFSDMYCLDPLQILWIEVECWLQKLKISKVFSFQKEVLSLLPDKVIENVQDRANWQLSMTVRPNWQTFYIYDVVSIFLRKWPNFMNSDICQVFRGPHHHERQFHFGS